MGGLLLLEAVGVIGPLKIICIIIWSFLRLSAYCSPESIREWCSTLSVKWMERSREKKPQTMYNHLCTCTWATSRPFIITKKNNGPNLVPWGIPALRFSQLDFDCSTKTRCWGFVRKFAHQLRRMGGTSRQQSFCSKILWSILSKALEKSIRQDLTMVFGLSVATSYWCRRWIKQCEVQEFLMHQIEESQVLA